MGQAHDRADKRTELEARLVEMVASLHEGQGALDAEVRRLLGFQIPDWSMLERLRDVADEFAARARQLRRMMSEAGAAVDANALEAVCREVDALCRSFEGTARRIDQATRRRAWPRPHMTRTPPSSIVPSTPGARAQGCTCNAQDREGPPWTVDGDCPLHGYGAPRWDRALP